MNADRFLEIIQDRELVPGNVLEKVREKITATGKEVPAKAVAKLLVDAGHLTLAQAKDVLATPAPQPEPPEPPQRPTDAEMAEKTINDDLDIVSDEDEESTTSDVQAPSEPPMVFELDEAGEVEGFVETDGIAEFPAEEDSDQRDALDETEEVAVESTGGRRGQVHWKKLFAGPGGNKIWKSKQWDSPLMLVGGGTLVVFLLLATLLVFYLWRGSGDDLFQAAERDYRDGAYNQSRGKYESFLKRFPRHPKASDARVRQRLARLRQEVENSKDWERALQHAKEDLPIIRSEEAFDDARPELSSLLPSIYGGFVEQARQVEGMQEARRLLDLAEETRALIDNSEYLPTSLREPLQPTIEDYQSEVEIVRREIDRQRDLASSIEEIRNAVRVSDVPKAFGIRRQLLETYPALVNNDQLRQSVLEIVAKQRQLVTSADAELRVFTDDPWSSRVKTVALADRVASGRAPGVESHVLTIRARGAIYGLDASTGRVRWRRFIGHETRTNAIPVAKRPSADVLLVDARHELLMRVDATTGDLVWRVPMPGAFADPVVVNDAVLVAMNSGMLIRLNIHDGQVIDAVQLPASLNTGPGYASRRKRIYQPGTATSLFVISDQTRECDEVYYLGHGANSIEVPPVALLGHVIIAENQGADYCLLHFIGGDEDGLNLARRRPPARLAGNVITPPIVFGKRVMLVTDRGSIHVYEIDPGATQNTVREVARLEGAKKQPLARHALFDQGQMWIADARLTKYQFHAARGELVQQWIRNDGDAFVAPLQRLGDVMFHVRQRRSAAGISVSAIRIATGPTASEDDGQLFWETELAVPLVGDLLWNSDKNRLVAVTAHGSVFALGPSNFRKGVSDDPLERSTNNELVLSFGAGAELPGDLQLFPGIVDAGKMLLFDPSAHSNRLRLVEFNIGRGRLGRPVSLGTGVLVASETGAVHFLDPSTGRRLAHPFQPSLSVDSTIQWQRPVVIHHQRKEFVIADSRGRVHKVGLVQEPRPHFAALTQTNLGGEVVAPLALLNDRIYIVTRDGSKEQLVSIGAADLSIMDQLPLDGRIDAGPVAVGDAMLVSTDSGQLTVFGPDGAMLWQSPVADRLILDNALLVDGQYIIATKTGSLWRVEKENGNVVAWDIVGDTGESPDSYRMGEPLSANPISTGKQLLLTGVDGTILVTAMPKTQ